MGNMSYCRFQNTESDLQDCYDHLLDEDLSGSEIAARDRIVELCRDIVNEYDGNYDYHEDEESEGAKEDKDDDVE